MARRNLEEKTALVTGASRGIGRAITHRLLKGGVQVLALTRDRLHAEPLEGVEWIQCDLGDKAQLNDFISSHASIFKEIDMLVNCAGFSDFGPVEKLPPDAAARHLQVMLNAPMALTRAVLPEMKKLNRGTIVNVTSLAVELPIPSLPLYNAAKAGLSGFTQSLLLDLNASAIRVIELRPGDFKTTFYASSFVPENLERREQDAWKAIREKVEKGSNPEKAATDLWHWLEGGQRGILRSGTWFECTLASLAARLLPGSWLRQRILRYYGL